MRKWNILAVVGSLRNDSFNLQLARKMGEVLGDRADFMLLDYRDVPLMNQDIEFPPPPAVRRVRNEVKAADGLWFFTPEYNHFFPGVLKNLIDWLSRPISDTEAQVLAHKPAAISGVSPASCGTGLAQDHLVTLISFLNMHVMNAPRLVIPNAMQLLDATGNLSWQSSQSYLEKQAAAYLEFLERHHRQ